MEAAASRIIAATAVLWEKEMTERLMDAADLERLTGKKRYSKQADWFKRNFDVDVVRCADGSLIMTWTQFDALMARKAGTSPTGSTSTVELCFD